MDAPIKPLFANDKPEPGGLFHNKEVAHITGLSASRLREYQKDRTVMVRQVYRSQWHLINRSDIAVYTILSELADSMKAHHTVLQAASRALYFWSTPAQETLPWHPITHAMYGGKNTPDLMWLLQFRFLRSAMTGQRQIQAYCYPENNKPRYDRDPKNGWMPVSDLHVNLTPLMVTLVARFEDYAAGGKKLPL